MCIKIIKKYQKLYLLSGYEYGNVIMWDLENKSICWNHKFHSEPGIIFIYIKVIYIKIYNLIIYFYINFYKYYFNYSNCIVFSIDVSNSLKYGVSVSADNIIAHFELNEVKLFFFFFFL